MQTTPIHGPALAKALENQNPGPASPTGPVVLPTWLVPWLVVLGAFATSWMGFELYDFSTRTWHPEKVPAFILSLLATLGVVSPGWRKSATRVGPVVAVVLALCLGAPALAAERAIYGSPQPRGLVSQELDLGAYVDLGVGAGVDVRAGRATMGVQALGTVALYELAPRWLLSAALGGSLLLGDAGPSGAGFLGGSLSLPAPPGPVMPAVYLGASYHLDGGWGFGGGLLLQI